MSSYSKLCAMVNKYAITYLTYGSMLIYWRVNHMSPLIFVSTPLSVATTRPETALRAWPQRTIKNHGEHKGRI